MATAMSSGHIQAARQPRKPGLFATLFDGWLRHAAFRRELRDLTSLSQRELDARGIDKRMITRTALERAFGKDR